MYVCIKRTRKQHHKAVVRQDREEVGGGWSKGRNNKAAEGRRHKK